MTRANYLDRARFICAEIVEELRCTTLSHDYFNSSHEGYAVIKEEFDKLWEAIKQNHHHPNCELREEAIQVAAMVLRFILDCTEKEDD